MAQGQLARAIERLRTLLGAQPGADSTDGELLDVFVAHRDEAAFAALVERYGPLVHGLCRRILGDESDADDAFQATFFVLAKKAPAIRRRASVGSWLYGVALRTAQRARLRAARRRQVETSALSGAVPMGERSVPDCDAAVTATWNELRGVLDEEVQRLPAKFRDPVRLCYLEGKTNEEAARLLGWPKGSVQSRLAGARELLRARLERRGVALAVGALGTLLTTQAAPAAVAASLKKTAIQGALLFAAGQTAGTISAPAVALANEVLKTMMAIKLRWALAIGLLAAALGGGAVLCALPSGEQPRTDLTPERPAPIPGLGYRERATVKTADVHWLALSPDGKLLATASNQAGELRLWNARTGKLVTELLSGPGAVGGLQFSPNAALLLVLRGGGLEIWDVAGARRIVDTKNGRELEFGGYEAVAFFPDGKRVAACRAEWTAGKPAGLGPQMVVELWDTDTGKQVATMREADAARAEIKGMTDEAPENQNPAPGFPALGARNAAAGIDSERVMRHLLTAGADGKPMAVVMNWQHSQSPQVWDLTANTLSDLPCQGLGHRVDFSADGKTLIAQTVAEGPRDGPVISDERTIPWTTEIWDLSARKMQARFSAIAFAVCREGVLVPDAGGTVHLLDFASGKTKSSFAAHAAAAATRARVEYPDPFNGFGPNREFIQDLRGGVRHLAVTPDGRTLVTVAEKVSPKRQQGQLPGAADGAPPQPHQDPKAADWWEVKIWERTDE